MIIISKQMWFCMLQKSILALKFRFTISNTVTDSIHKKLSWAFLFCWNCVSKLNQVKCTIVSSKVNFRKYANKLHIDLNLMTRTHPCYVLTRALFLWWNCANNTWIVPQWLASEWEFEWEFRNCINVFGCRGNEVVLFSCFNVTMNIRQSTHIWNHLHKLQCNRFRLSCIVGCVFFCVFSIYVKTLLKSLWFSIHSGLLISWTNMHLSFPWWFSSEEFFFIKILQGNMNFDYLNCRCDVARSRLWESEDAMMMMVVMVGFGFSHIYQITNDYHFVY